MHSSFIGRSVVGLGAALVLPLVFTTVLPARADDDSFAATGVGVARLSSIWGNVSVQRGDQSDSVAGAVNAPLVGGDFLSTGDGSSRTEVQFDNVTDLRLDRDTQIRFTKIDNGNREVQVAQGTAELSLLQGPDGTSQIDTPSLSIRPDVRGDYRTTVTGDGRTIFSVRVGRADVLLPNGTQTLNEGQTMYAQGPASDPQTNVGAAVAFDDFDTFNADRDKDHLAQLAHASWNNPYIDGVDDLYRYGRWVNDPGYGNVWVPSVEAGWAPYHTGRWVWEEGYGWTWVAAEPWGWAPYHYGRWFYARSYGWAWYPPAPAIYAPVYASHPPVIYQPALVAFFTFGGGGTALSVGFNSGGGFNLGFSNIGWVPLAPFEVYHPWYAGGFGNHYGPTIVNRTVINNYNTTTITNINNGNITKIYANANAPGAVAAVNSRRFVEGNFTQTQTLRAADVQSLSNAAAIRGALPVVPTQRNLRFAAAASATGAVALSPAFARGFAGHAAAVERTPFETQRTTLATYVAPLAAKAADPAHLPATPVDAFRNPRTAGVAGVSGRVGTADLAPVKPAGPTALNLRRTAGAVQAPGTQSQDQTQARTGSADAWSRFNDQRANGTVRPNGDASATGDTTHAISHGYADGSRSPANVDARTLPTYARPAATTSVSHSTALHVHQNLPPPHRTLTQSSRSHPTPPPAAKRGAQRDRKDK
jgi:hypothetical protein